MMTQHSQLAIGLGLTTFTILQSSSALAGSLGITGGQLGFPWQRW
ncbi:MAG: hypothetical protein ACFB14_22445 [Leptolyngbyaceae cyanobacterium]